MLPYVKFAEDTMLIFVTCIFIAVGASAEVLVSMKDSKSFSFS